MADSEPPVNSPDPSPSPRGSQVAADLEGVLVALGWVMLGLLSLVVGLVAAAVVGNSYFSEQPTLYRVVGVVAVALVAVFFALQTEQGKALLPTLTQAFDSMEMKLDEMLVEEKIQPLRLAFPPSFAHYGAVPLLADDFMNCCPPSTIRTLWTRPVSPASQKWMRWKIDRETVKSASTMSAAATVMADVPLPMLR